jgi:glucuronate isomerase
MSLELRRRIFDQLDSLVIIDPHTHINPLDPASHSLADILGYHYYTELAHSAGLAQETIEDPTLSPKEKVGLLISNLGSISNTAQWSWFVEMARQLFGFQGGNIDESNWEQLYDDAERQMSYSEWPGKVLEKSKLSAVFLTNDFDDPLEGFDTQTYIPCLRTDDLVFKLSQYEVRDRLERVSGIRPTTPEALRQAIGAQFDHFVARGARACAISLPPDFSPLKVSSGRAHSALEAIEQSGADCSDSHKKAIANFVFWTLCEYCADFGLPFDLMIGVNRAVYPAGVHQGRDLYDSRVSLHQYKDVFNAFPQVKFPISVLASVTNQELTSYAWIFPNVITSGHWWYSNTPTFIEHDLAARLEAVPRTKQIGYYSDMYKLEFALPKFAMYKRCLAKVLAEKFVQDRGWSEEQAVALGTQVLQGNTEAIFPAIPLEKIELRREKLAAGPSLSEPYPHDTFDSVAGPKLDDPVVSTGGMGLPIGGEMEAGSLAALAAAPLLPSTFDERMEPTIHLDHLATEGSAIHSGSMSPEVHLPEFHPHVRPQTEEDREALDEELSTDPEWKHELPPMETGAPLIDTHDEPLVASFEDDAMVSGEAIENAQEIVLETHDETPLEEEFQLSLEEQVPPAPPPANFDPRATVPFDPKMYQTDVTDLPTAEVAEEVVEEIELEEVPAAKPATPPAADDDFADILEALDLEPESPTQIKPPETNEPPKADPNDPFSFLKK